MSTVSPKSGDSEFIGSTFATIFVGAGIISSLSGFVSIGALYKVYPLSTAANFPFANSAATICTFWSFSSFIEITLNSFVVPVFGVPSVLNTWSAQITSASGTELNAEDTVKLETFPALVDIFCFSTLTFSDQKLSTRSPLSSFKFAASSWVSSAVPSWFSNSKSPL